MSNNNALVVHEPQDDDYINLRNEIDLFEGDYTKRFPISPLFAIKKTLPLIMLLLSVIGLWIFGGSEFHSFRNHIMGALGWDRPVLYYIGCTVLLGMVMYWMLYIWRFTYGVKDGMLYIGKGVVIRNTYDYPITSIENIILKRDLFDFLLGLCTVKLMTAHDESDDLAALRGMHQSQAQELHGHLRNIINSYQSSRHDIVELKQKMTRTGSTRTERKPTITVFSEPEPPAREQPLLNSPKQSFLDSLRKSVTNSDPLQMESSSNFTDYELKVMVAFLMAQAAYADGKVSNRERVEIRSVLESNLGMTFDESSQVLDVAEFFNGKRDRLQKLGEMVTKNFSLNQRETLLAMYIRVIEADGEVKPEELCEMHNILDVLSLSRTSIKKAKDMIANGAV